MTTMTKPNKLIARNGNLQRRPRRVESVFITPEIAKELLKNNLGNRPLNQRNLDKLRSSLVNGYWVFNGQTISVDKDGNVMDGQHRLHAVIETGIAIETLLAYDVSPSAFSTIDNGRVRSGGDTLALMGVDNYNLVTSALRWIDRYETGQPLGSIIHTNDDVLRLYSAHPGIEAGARLCQPGNRIMSAAILCACHYLYSLQDKDQADCFALDLISGTNLSKGDGVLVLRNRLIRDKSSKGSLAHSYVFALTIKAWNARRKGVFVKTLRWSQEAGEMFPVIE